ncbi:thiamine-phosphate synthase [Paenibacillus sp. J45TS6]|uniref:thiamine phosphate synthase n=1 Tax=unclassified Paenibacillus TaxID=185978 RepID=UPI001AFFE058|nr:thiamine phosphate synthase [Paenibacillus sp. J45TS6]GIP44961.1 thiamine-phosphate synthase [Paenibacillus sp. J45TS6]
MTRISSSRMKALLQVYFVMGSQNCKKSPESTLAEAIQGGITLFQYREKGPGSIGEKRMELALHLQQLCREQSVPFIVNDDVDLAIAIAADGVHIGQDDEETVRVRERIGDMILGVSAHTLEEARLAQEQGADYIGVGPIYPTSSKEDAHAVQGPEIIESMRAHDMDIPIVGIGGITSVNAARVLEAGADGVAVISAISLPDDIAESVKGLRH